MKQTIFTLLLIATLGFVSCRKDSNHQSFKQYDQSQIENYISANSITGMVKDTAGGDTTGIYYKNINAGSGTPLTYTDNVSFVFSLKSFDGKYSSVDTIANHYQGYVGHIISANLPVGLELAVINDLKYSGGSMRVLIPSHLAYGVNGYGTGSITNTSSRIAGNQCLDYYIHVINKQPDPTHAQQAYDDQVIQSYIKTNSLTGYIKAESKVLPGNFYYYKVAVQGTGTDSITQNSTITTTYAGRLLNNNFFETANNAIADTAQIEVPTLLQGQQDALSHVTTGATISVIFPSVLGGGRESFLGTPANSCLRYEYEIKRVSP